MSGYYLYVHVEGKQFQFRLVQWHGKSGAAYGENLLSSQSLGASVHNVSSHLLGNCRRQCLLEMDFTHERPCKANLQDILYTNTHGTNTHKLKQTRVTYTRPRLLTQCAHMHTTVQSYLQCCTWSVLISSH